MGKTQKTTNKSINFAICSLLNKQTNSTHLIMSKNTCVIKFVHKDDVRRVRIDTSNFTFHECKRKSQELYPDLLNGSIQYKDDEDELCTISNNTELAEAFYVVEQSDKRSCLRLFIAKEENNVQNSKTTTTFMNRHQNVVKQTKSTKPKTSKPLKASAKNTMSTKSTKSTNDTQTDSVKSLFQDNDKNTETSKKPVVVIAKKKKNPWSKGETKTDPTDPTDSTKTKTVSAKALKVVQQRAVAIPKARFIKDSKGSHPALLPGQPFSHTWRLMNNGKEKWNENVSVRCVGGDAMKGSEMSVPVACIGPNQVVDATIQLSAPEVPGRYICYFRLHQQNERFGDRIWIDVTVVDPDKLSDKQMNAMFPVAQQQDMKVEQKEVNLEQKDQVEQAIQDEQVEPEMEEEMEIV